MIIADENIDESLINKLRNYGFEVYSIREKLKGESDKIIIDLAKEKDGILITEDKDFGEWVFSHNVKGLSIIFLRYKNVSEYESMENNDLKILQNYTDKPKHKFITITHYKVRIREI